MNNYETIQVVYKNPVLTITFNRPEKANAMNRKMSAEIEDVLTLLKSKPDCKYVVLTGAGKHFSAGADLVEAADSLKTDPDVRLTMRNDQLARQNFMRKFDELEQVTIAAINGPMYGAGFATAMVCDFRVMTETATACLPEAERGMFFTAGCTGRLVNLVGPAKSKELIMFCDVIDARESFRIGLVNKVVSDAQLFDEIDLMINKLERSPFLPLKMTKTIVNAATPPDNTLMYELELLELIFEKSDVTKSMKSFIKS